MAPSARGVVFQAATDDPAVILAALRQAEHLLAAITEQVPVEIVVQSGAVRGLLADSEFVPRIAEVTARRPTIRVLACRNAVRAQRLDESELSPAVDIVPAGVAHLAERQWEGWAYLRTA